MDGTKQRLLDRMIPEHGAMQSMCLVYSGNKNESGYGEISYRGKTARAHRVSYELFIGPIPDGLQLDHLCRNRACIHPWHLEPVTQAENTRRGISANGTKTHCPSGHEYTAENTRVLTGVTGGSYRQCRTCDRDRVRARYQTNPSYRQNQLAYKAARWALKKTLAPHL